MSPSTTRRAAAPARPLAGWTVAPLKALIRGYQLLLSPLWAPTCRYHPSCSSYAIEALERHGVARGGWLALRRLARCHPWGGDGVDPVPEPGGRHGR